jgi:hypothetical protein
MDMGGGVPRHGHVTRAPTRPALTQVTSRSKRTEIRDKNECGHGQNLSQNEKPRSSDGSGARAHHL